jgi:hypothetical protein
MQKFIWNSGTQEGFSKSFGFFCVPAGGSDIFQVIRHSLAFFS